MMPAATGPYRDIRADMEQTWAMVVRPAADTFRNIPCQRGCELGAFPAPGTVLKIVTDRTSLMLGRLVRRRCQWLAVTWSD